MKLYKFSRFFGRNGDLEGLFIAEPEQINKLIGSHINFGEALGKHSEVSCIIEEKDINQLDVLDSTVDDIIKVIGTSISGYNPFDYLEEEEN